MALNRPLTPEEEQQWAQLLNDINRQMESMPNHGAGQRDEIMRQARERFEANLVAQEPLNNPATGYGGKAGAADEFKGLQRDIGLGAQNRQGVIVNYGDANAARDLGLQARGQQVGMADLMARRARGETPSIAQMQADRQMGQAVSAQNSLAASARGPAALALAQQTAAGNASQAQSAISNQAQINAANERLQAEQAAFGAYSGTRQGDQALQGQEAQQAQTQAGLFAQQRGLNDAMTQGMMQGEHAVNVTQAQIEQNKAAMKAGKESERLQNMWAQEQAKREQMQGALMGGAQMMGAAFGAMSDERVKNPVEWRPDVISGGREPTTVEAAKREAEEALERADLERMAAKNRLETPEKAGRDTKRAPDGLTSEQEKKWSGLVAGGEKQPEGEGGGWKFARGMAAGAGSLFGALIGPRQPRPYTYVPQMQQITSGMETKDPLAYPDMITSDDRAKLARAWDEGHSAALENVRRAAARPAEDLSKDAEGGHEASAVARALKADAWDEGNRAAGPQQEEMSGPRGKTKPLPNGGKAASGSYVKPDRAAQDAQTAENQARFRLDAAQTIPPAPGMAPVKIAQDFLAEKVARPAPTETGPMAFLKRRLLSDEETKQRDGAAPPSVEADAARRLQGHPYRYKPGFGEDTGQVHYGPNAQELEKNPITATAVKKGPDGIRRLDPSGLHRVEMSTIGALQEQVDELKSLMARRIRGGRK